MVTAFVLTGQGSLAAQHVGMLQALARHGIAPDLLLGSSAGAANAAYIAGYGTGPWALRRLAALWAALGRREMFPRLRQSGQQPEAGSTGQRSPAPLQRLLRSQLPYVRIEEARIPVHLLARDARTGSGVILSNGFAVSAVMASCAVPGVLPAVQRKGRTLCDGGPAIGKALRDAVAMGAQRIVVLATGRADLVTDPPSQPFQGQQSLDVVATGAVTLHVVPLPVSPGVSRSDYGRAPTLIHAARETASAWLESGGLARPDLRADTWCVDAAVPPDLSGARSA